MWLWLWPWHALTGLEQRSSCSRTFNSGDGRNRQASAQEKISPNSSRDVISLFNGVCNGCFMCTKWEDMYSTRAAESVDKCSCSNSSGFFLYSDSYSNSRYPKFPSTLTPRLRLCSPVIHDASWTRSLILEEPRARKTRGHRESLRTRARGWFTRKEVTVKDSRTGQSQERAGIGWLPWEYVLEVPIRVTQEVRKSNRRQQKNKKINTQKQKKTKKTQEATLPYLTPDQYSQNYPREMRCD